MWSETLIVVVTGAAAAGIAVIVANLVMMQRGIEYDIRDVPAADSPDFVRLLAGLITLKLSSGNRIRLLINGEEAFPAMFGAVREAKHSVTFENYIYWSGDIGDEFADLLAEKSRAGVRVHLVLDWIGSLKMDHKALRRMRRAGVEVHRYHRPRFGGMHRLNHRTHRRELIVDGQVAFTGGVGFADEWQGNGRTADHWRDNHYEIRGPLVSDMQAVFLDNWLKTSGDVLFGDRYFPETEAAGDHDAAALRSSPNERTTSGRLMILMMVTAARRTIRIEQAYFVPDRHLRTALAEAAERGVRVEILLPSEIIDISIVRSASRASWGPLLRAGVQIYEYQAAMLHVKSMVVDDQWVLGGSANLDYRSMYRNDEVYLVVRDREIARQHVEVFERDKQDSVRITYDAWRSRPMREKVVESLSSLLRTQL